MIATIEALKELFERDLNSLSEEINAYEKEADLWVIEKEISNSAGNLCLHLCGNLQHFYGHLIGDLDYVRQRDDEFNLKNVPRKELLVLIEKSRLAVIQALDEFDTDLWDKPFPIEVFGQPMTYAFFMMHLSGHLNYHLGQINYHRRLLG